MGQLQLHVSVSVKIVLNPQSPQVKAKKTGALRYSHVVVNLSGNFQLCGNLQPWLRMLLNLLLKKKYPDQ